MRASTKGTLAMLGSVLMVTGACFVPRTLGGWSATGQNASTNVPGWHTQGLGKWRSEKGEIVGVLPSGAAGPAWLIQDRRYEDFELRFWFQCGQAEAGVLMQAEQNGHGSEGIYVSICGANLGELSHLTLNPDGTEHERSKMGTPRNQDPDEPAHFPWKSDGWNEIELFLRGEMLVISLNGYRARPYILGRANRSGLNHYGHIALGLAAIAGAQFRIKDISTEDLLHRELPAQMTGKGFREQRVSDLFYSEGIAVGDLNRDGHLDLVAGPFYYLGPDFKQAREIYPATTFNPNTPPYTDSFLNYVYDFNGDGWPDVLKINFEGAYLYINPQGENRHWEVFKVVDGIASETTQFADIDGDGRPELILSQKSSAGGQAASDAVQIAYAKPDWSNATKPWKIHPVSEAGVWGGHGLGIGDINGDGRLDIVQASGWWEQPPPGDNGLWKFHAAPFRGEDWTEMQGPWAGGSDMLVYDVNGDGLPDVITSLAAHGWGLAWFEQARDSTGNISWKKHMIMGNPSAPDRADWEETDKSVAFSEIHALALADIDGDGLKDVVAGKRWWSHGDNYSGPDAQAPPVLYWFQLVRKAGGSVEWVPHLISNHSGIGTQILATDLNGDGRPDVLTTARTGTFVFLNCADCR
jgi:FG-GAP-like repeat/Domain of Unknown Function (DUF1080)